MTRVLSIVLHNSCVQHTDLKQKSINPYFELHKLPISRYIIESEILFGTRAQCSVIYFNNKLKQIA